MKYSWVRFIVLIIAFAFTAAADADADEEARLELTFAGDIMAHDANYRTSDYNAIYADVAPLLQADDLTFGNLETPVNEDLKYAGFPLFNVHLAYARAAVTAGFDVFALANNHSRDKGDLGMLKTLSALVLLRDETKEGVWYSGVRGDPARPFAPVTIYRNGFKIGFLAVTQFLNVQQAAPYVQVVNYSSKAEARQFIDWVKSIAPQYDLLVLSYHGDLEYKLAPSPAKVEFFRALARAGVNIVMGHHPHVVQPYESVAVNGARRLIMYSLGNFVSGMGLTYAGARPENPMAFTGDSFLLPVRIVRASAGGVDVAPGEPVFITSFSETNGDIVVKRLEPLASGLPEGKWRDYYLARLALMRKFVAEMASYIPSEKPAAGKKNK
jgi:poly-gamma-glutamate capsule biosynthesis protein CapA/YwtB (metallophosphatase superfamily)